MASADYKAYIQAEIEECKRLADVYQGVEDDLGAANEHLAIEHLEALLTRPMSNDLRGLYLSEYQEIRAVQRAVAMTLMTRKDFYDNACHERITDREYYATLLASSTHQETLFMRGLPDEQYAELQELKEEYELRKAEIVNRLKAQGAASSTSDTTDADIIRITMENVEGVNSRGVSTSRKRVL